jgi:hypothetical protein
VACAQTPASQQNESPWKQTPEGRSPGIPGQQQPMNCSGSITSGDGKVEKISNCPAPSAQPQAPTGASQQFPYPGDSTPAAQTNPAAPAAKQTPGSAGQEPASKQFPYPGEDASGSSSSSAGAAKPAPPAGDGLQDAGSSGTSSSSSSSSSSSAGPDNGADGDTGTAAPVRARRRRAAAGPRLTPTQREAEDLQVAGFYQNDGDFRGAYLRAKDAVSIADADPDAHLALGEAARKLGKLDEAEQNYRRCLQLDPVPKSRKTAEKALKEMTGGE